ncbi:MAG TPA: porin family protein [Bacteroidales bacterium]|nr:porin family protein [Bacteroidales bacterium]HPF04106.1 porin family protein [Bacteroidales bacterium]HPJ59879.1 porin family protein [Bacteroidales bacterium]HPR11370.1 porin family protein [Bacteroidales bacterium]HRW85680.1 porin family protein [Bacteroidales bacterium]
MKTKLLSSILVLLILAPFSTIQSQEKGRTSFGILAGVNFQNINGKDILDNKLENGLLFGYHGGLNVQIPIAPDFYLQPGLLYSLKGADVNPDGDAVKHKLSYLELPINFLYKGQLGSGFILLGFGPYVGYAAAGNVVDADGDKTKIEFKNEVTPNGVTTVYYKHFDAGGNIFFGYELQAGLFFQLNAQLGLIKINPDYAVVSDDNLTWKNTGFGLSVGYRF